MDAFRGLGALFGQGGGAAGDEPPASVLAEWNKYSQQTHGTTGSVTRDLETGAGQLLRSASDVGSQASMLFSSSFNKVSTTVSGVGSSMGSMQASLYVGSDPETYAWLDSREAAASITRMRLLCWTYHSTHMRVRGTPRIITSISHFDVSKAKSHTMQARHLSFGALTHALAATHLRPPPLPPPLPSRSMPSRQQMLMFGALLCAAIFFLTLAFTVALPTRHL